MSGGEAARAFRKRGLSILIKLVSMAGTGYYYVCVKNPRTHPNKLEKVLYDPRVNRKVLFTEERYNKEIR